MKKEKKVLEYLKSKSRNCEGMDIISIPRRKISAALKIPQSSMYYILKDLLHQGEVKVYRDGRKVCYYRIIPD